MFADACVAGFHLTGVQCEPCPIGTYKETSDDSNCLDCPPGKDTSQINSTECGKLINRFEKKTKIQIQKK